MFVYRDSFSIYARSKCSNVFIAIRRYRHMWHITHIYVRHDIYVHHDTSICVPWFIFHTCSTQVEWCVYGREAMQTYLTLHTHMCVPWHIYMCTVTRFSHMQDLSIVMCLWPSGEADMFVVTHTYVCTMTRLYVYRYLFFAHARSKSRCESIAIRHYRHI